MKLFLSCLLLAALCCGQEIRLQEGRIVVSGWRAPDAEPAAGWSSVLAVFAGAGDVPPTLGTYTVESGNLSFHPRFPFSPGIRVRAVLRTPAPIEAWFEIPKRDVQPTTKVAGVYPSAAVIPENQLKFYIEFSAPMQRGEAWDRIHLLDAKGKRVDLPFLEIDQELWDRDTRRLTVLFDPGRIKRGVLPLEEVGPALENKHSYTLVVDRDWRDANGTPLQEAFRKQFRVGAADRDPPATERWTLSSPAAGTTEPLVVSLGEPLDYALLHRMVKVESVDGTIRVAANESEWRFTPSQPWRAGDYKLVVDTALEDLAGNRIGRPFDVDIFERVTTRVQSRTVSLPFRVSSEKR